MIIYLIGLPGVGKTTFGQKLARRLGYHFSDLDAVIAAHQKRSIAELFALGEAHFRALESAALKRLSTAHNSVVASGGGVVCRPDNIALMRATGKVVYLKRPLDDIIKTLDATTRPLLANDASYIVQLYRARAALYRRAAHCQLDIVDQARALTQLAEVLCENSSN